ncbi:MAG: AraC family transcriptional regulator ligand-binding domain-containing protein [Labilithrix sp.]|nr:AraC family transcriptional regulator ligand-binding domain-containing protein [Labilithrix sp.]
MGRAETRSDAGERRATSIRVSSFVLTWPRLLGLSLREVAYASSLPLAKLEAGDELTYEETLQLWAGIEELTADPVWSIRAGSRFTLDQMGVVGPAIAHATHLDAALDVLVHVMKQFVRNAAIARVDTDDAAGFEYRMPTLRSRHGADTIFAATLALTRHATGVHVVPRAIEHQMPRQSETAYRDYFGVVPRWNRPATQLLFRRADLALPFRGASPMLANLLVEHAPRLMAPTRQPVTFEQELHRAFWSAHEAGDATLATVASELGLSARTLQRKLESMRTSFGAARAQILHQRADQLLLEGSLSVEEIAERLGFSSRGAFERAYLRWSGKRPSAARRAPG